MISTYSALPLGTYIDILAIDKTLNEYDYKVKVVALLSGLSEDEILDQPLTKTMKMSEAANFLLAPLPKATGKKVASLYRFGGEEFTPCKDVSKWTTSQFIDFQTYAKRINADTLPELYSCILIPKGHTYGNGYDIAEVVRIIRDSLPVTDAQDISAFFLRKFTLLSRSILTSSLPALRKMRTKESREMEERVRQILPLLKSGAGLLT